MDISGQAIAAGGHFSVALSGGNTPRRLYEYLSSAAFREKIRWDVVHIFWSDERCVPISDQRSNARMVQQTLLAHVPIPTRNIHAIRGDLPPAEAAETYESELRRFFGDQPPVLDLVLLGLGEDGHTASLFPGTPVLKEKERWVSEVYIPGQDVPRVTLTPVIINQAARVVFLVTGAEKAPALQITLEGEFQPQKYPAQLIHPDRATPTWLVDEPAAQQLTKPPL